MKSIITPAPMRALRPQLGDEVSVHFVGTLEDGKVFDDSRKKGDPFKFRLGLGQVIKGWDRGVATMFKGERALFTMHPELAYGEEGAGWKIPKNATLRFDVELVDVEELDPLGEEWEYEDEEEEEEAVGRDDVGPGGEDPRGRYRWERRGQEVVVVAPMPADVGTRDVSKEFRPKRVYIAVKGEVLLDGVPGCELDIEECFWDFDVDVEGNRVLLVHLMKKDALKVRWPPTLFESEDET
mmetsp:Transcript_125518/g.280082  ORF Transcript_125518/g.280082 Transcript_125518/m.280082 type:complete len:239 (+) Transcript_125518:3-719(+)